MFKTCTFLFAISFMLHSTIQTFLFHVALLAAMYFILHMLYKKSAALPSLSFVPQDTFGQEMYALIT